jgi:hypothetical protein
MTWPDHRHLTSATVSLLALSALCGAQSFEYQDFSNGAGLALNGNALLTSNLLRVAASAGSQKGTVYYDTPVRVVNGFDTVFKFQINALSAGGADGMTFVIQNDPRGTTAMGINGGELAYGAGATAPPGTAIANSILVELDTYYSGAQADLSDNEVSIHTNGVGDNDNDEYFSLGHVSPTVNLSDGQTHSLRVNFDSGTLRVFLDDLVNPLIAVPYDFTTGGQWINNGGPVGGLNLQPGGLAYVGFTAATGGAWENHDVLSWTWSSSGGPGTAFCYGDLSGGVCPCGNISAAGEGCVNSMAMGGILGSSGSSSVALADFRLAAQQVPPFKPGLFVQADTVQNGGNGSFYGDGLRCVDANILFLQVVFTDGGGTASSTLDLISAGGIGAGQTRTYQYWYRDPPGPCSSGYNATNGLSVVFLP